MIPLVLLACGADEAPPPAAPSFTDPEAPWLGAEVEDPVDLDLDRVTEAIEAAFAALDELDPGPLLAIHDRLLADGDAGCPSFYTASEGFTYWLDDCVATSGARFAGFGVAEETPGVTLDDGLLGTTTTVGGSGSLVGADGTTLEMNGFLQLTTAALPGVDFETLVISGSLATDAAEATGTWLGAPWEPELTRVTYDLPGGRVRTATGVIEDLEIGGARLPVVLQDVLIAEATTGLSDCSDEPTGVISVRLDGDWVDVLFDPVDTGSGIVTEPGACDGCGEAWSGVTPLGRACPDVAALLGQ